MLFGEGNDPNLFVLLGRSREEQLFLFPVGGGEGSPNTVKSR